MTVRRAMAMPSVRSSNVIREADHFRVRRIASISATISAAVAVGWWCGVLDRSSSPRSPYLRYRLTQVEAHCREIPISAATWAIGRLWHRSIRRRLPSTVRGALRCVTGLVPLLLMVSFATSILPRRTSPSTSVPRQQRPYPQHLGASASRATGSRAATSWASEPPDSGLHPAAFASYPAFLFVVTRTVRLLAISRVIVGAR